MTNLHYRFVDYDYVKKVIDWTQKKKDGVVLLDKLLNATRSKSNGFKVVANV